MRLLGNPVLVREMEVRAGRDEGYRLFNYCGPGLYLLLLESPPVAAIILGDLFASMQRHGSANLILPSVPFLVTAWLQVIYFSHAAARFTAGSVAVERERGTLDAMRLLPRSVEEVFAGKYWAAIAPLLVEALVAIPLLGLYCVAGAVHFSTVLACGILNVFLILFFGLWGMHWSVRCREVHSALSRSFATVLGFNVMPLIASFVVLFFLGPIGDARVGAIFSISPLYLVGGMTVPVAWNEPLWHLSPTEVALVLLTMALISLRLYRNGLRRLGGR
ncbi:MAG: hypothetical protein FJX76_22925 [Armatimonadetes bacterium]|nr:hypothetical protein [Armatimonadota bacterium]